MADDATYIRFGEDLLSRLRREAAADERAVAQVVRRIVRAHYAQQDSPKAAS